MEFVSLTLTPCHLDPSPWILIGHIWLHFPEKLMRKSFKSSKNFAFYHWENVSIHSPELALWNPSIPTFLMDKSLQNLNFWVGKFWSGFCSSGCDCCHSRGCVSFAVTLKNEKIVLYWNKKQISTRRSNSLTQNAMLLKCFWKLMKDL